MNETSRSLRRLGYLLDPLGLTDGQLLERFRTQQDEAAFEAIVRRHGPMVLGVCRRILRNQHDAEDAFQATFFVLARKSAAIAKERMAANWLYGVAYRTAWKAKTQVDRLHANEKSMAHLPEQCQGSQTSANDLEIMLDRELQRLPDKYRAPLVLCELEGRTHQEAAKLLGWPPGTLSVRLMRAKKLLAKRLTGQNLASATGSLAALLSTDWASASVSPALLATTAKTASLFAACEWAPAIPVKVAALAEGVLKSMLLSKVKSLMAVLVLVGFLGTGAAYSTQLVTAGGEGAKRIDRPNLIAQGPEKPKNDRDIPQEQPRRDGKEILPPGALARFGSLAFRIGKVRGAPVMSPDGRSIYIRTEKGIDIYDLDTGLSVRHFPMAPSFPLDAFCLSKDGALLAAGNMTGSFLWDTKSGQQLRKLETLWVVTAAFSPDGKKLVVGNDGVDGNNNVAKTLPPGMIDRQRSGLVVIDVASGKKEVRLVEAQETIAQVLFTPDGQTLITVSQTKPTIYATDMRSKKIVHSLHSEGARAPLVALSPDGKTLAVTDALGQPPLRGICTMRFVDLASGQSRDVDSKEVPQSEHKAMLYSPDGGYVLIAAGSKCHIIDARSGTRAGEIPCPSYSFHFTLDGRRLVFLDAPIIRVWDFATAQELHAPKEPTEVAEHVSWSPDGTILASWSDKSPIYCWSAASGQMIGRLKADVKNHRWSSAQFAPDGRLVSSGNDGAIRVWDTTTFTDTTRFDVPNLGMGSINAATDGRTVAALTFPPPKMPAPPALPKAPLGLLNVRSAELPGYPEVRLFAWDLASGKLLTKSDLPAMNPDAPLIGPAIQRGLPILSPGGKTYIARSGAEICLKDIVTDKELVKLKPNPQPLSPESPDVIDPNFIEGPASFSADRKTVALSVARLAKTKVPTVKGDLNGALPGIAVLQQRLKDRAKVGDYGIVVFDVASGKEHCRISMNSAQSRPFVLAPDGRRVAGIFLRSARIWDSLTGKLLWEAPDIGVTAIAFSPDGNRLVTALADTTMLVWDVRTTMGRVRD